MIVSFSLIKNCHTKGPLTGPAYTLKPKEVCIPKFTVKIEGNAVEEGARVFFEGIVDAQPPPGRNISSAYMKNKEKNKFFYINDLSHRHYFIFDIFNY